MKKSDYPLESRIVDTALEMFNATGIEYVGMRELATALGIRIGNLTYYFPTKDDLVYRLSLHLAEENSRTIITVDAMTMPHFFDMVRMVFRNHLKYRCLMLSFVHIMQRNPLIAKRYSKTQVERSDTWSKNIQALIAAKYLIADDEEAQYLLSSLSLIARFWISEAAISFRSHSDEDQMNHYVKMIARAFLPYCTAKGRKCITEVLSYGGGK